MYASFGSLELCYPLSTIMVLVARRNNRLPFQLQLCKMGSVNKLTHEYDL